MTQAHNDTIVELTDAELTDVQGGIALLLPAVQKVREAAARSSGLSEDDSRGVATAG